MRRRPGSTGRNIRVLAMCAGLLAISCQTASEIPTSMKVRPGADVKAVTIYVASDGWHSAIIFSRALLPSGAVPEAADFPKAAYLSFDWGDAAYFPAREPTFAMTLSAALVPTRAVIRLTGLRRHPKQAYPKSTVLELKVSHAGFRKLIAYLDGTFDRNQAARARSVEPGNDAFSLFYKATGKFHLFNTCNTWTARGLAAAGWPIQVFGIISGDDLMAELRPLAAKQN